MCSSLAGETLKKLDAHKWISWGHVGEIMSEVSLYVKKYKIINGMVNHFTILIDYTKKRNNEATGQRFIA